MFLQLEKSPIPMRRVYLLSKELEADPEQVALAQALTLNAAKPHLGLKGAHGLFASPEWWANIEQRKMPLLLVSGVIQRAYVAGQDESAVNNGVDLRLDDGSIRSDGIYTNDKNDVALFREGHRVAILYAQDEMKQQPAFDGGIDYSDIALEVAVSLEPVK